LLAPSLSQLGAAPFHQQFAERMSYRPAHVSVLLTAGGDPLPATLTIIDSAGRRTGGTATQGHVGKAIPFSDVATIRNDQGIVIGQLVLIASLDPGALTIQIDRQSGTLATPLTLSVVTPAAGGGTQQVAFEQIVAHVPAHTNAPQDPNPFS